MPIIEIELGEWPLAVPRKITAQTDGREVRLIFTGIKNNDELSVFLNKEQVMTLAQWLKQEAA